MDDVDTAKQALRARILAGRRDRLARPDGAQERAAADAALTGIVAAYLAQLAPGRRVCRVAAYEAWRSEPPTAGIIAGLRAAGHEVVLPVVLADLGLDWDLDGRLLGRDGLRGCDLVLTPGLAVDRTGRRLGQGGGCYDRALPHVRAGTPVLTVLWDDELLDEPVPAQPHDLPVDGVVTPGRGVVPLRLSPSGPG